MEPASAALVKVAAKEAGQVLKKESEGFLRAVLGEPGRALGSLLGEKINRRRHANLIKMTVEAKRKLAEAGVSAKEVPLSIIHPMLEAASLEEDPDLQNMWANLIANAADPRQTSPVSPVFSVILKELSSRDAKFLDVLFTNTVGVISLVHEKRELEDLDYTERNLIEIYARNGLARLGSLSDLTLSEYLANQEDADQDRKEFKLTFDMVRRHGIIRESIYPRHLEGWQREQTYNRNEMLGFDLRKKYSFSHIGSSFMRACRPPSSQA